MSHSLVRGRDVQRRRVVVRAEMRTGQSSFAQFNQLWQQGTTGVIENDLRRLDHHFEAQGPVGQSERTLKLPQHRHRVPHLLGEYHFRDRDDEPLGECAGAAHQRGNDEVERAYTARAQLLVQRLHPYANERWQGLLRHPLRQCAANGNSVSVFLGIGTVAVAILKVNAKIFHRLTRQLFLHAIEDGLQ